MVGVYHKYDSDGLQGRELPAARDVCPDRDPELGQRVTQFYSGGWSTPRNLARDFVLHLQIDFCDANVNDFDSGGGGGRIRQLLASEGYAHHAFPVSPGTSLEGFRQSHVLLTYWD